MAKKSQNYDYTAGGNKYRQYIAKTITYIDADGGSMSTPYNFAEDVDTTTSGTTLRYGHRTDAQKSIDMYLPVRSTGGIYALQDYPGMRAESGATFIYDAEFTGRIIDVCNNDSIVKEATWKVYIKSTIPTEDW